MSEYLPNPVKPSEFEEIVKYDSSTSICDRIINTFIRFPQLVNKWVSWAFDSTGKISRDFAYAMAMKIAPGSSSLPGTPTDLKISSKYQLITFSWAYVSNATEYVVARSINNVVWEEFSNFATTNLYFTDNTVTDGTTYYYKVKGRNSVGDGDYSVVRNATAYDAGTWRVFNYVSGTEFQTFSVPATADTVVIECWAGGGHGAHSPGISVGPAGGGGGGYACTTIGSENGNNPYQSKDLTVVVGGPASDSSVSIITGGSRVVLCSSKAGQPGDALNGGPGGTGDVGSTKTTGFAGGNGGATTPALGGKPGNWNASGTNWISPFGIGGSGSAIVDQTSTAHYGNPGFILIKVTLKST